MTIKFNSREDFRQLQNSIAYIEEAMMRFFNEEGELTIEFGEITEDADTGLFLPYTIYSYCNEPIKHVSFNIAR